jgi:hypothetical protein
MKALIISAAIGAIAASGAASASESWIAASPIYDARSGGDDQSFAAGAFAAHDWRDSGDWRDSADWRFRGDDGDKWFGHGERGGDDGDEWHDHPIGVAPEAATWQLLLLGAAALGLVRLRTARRS